MATSKLIRIALLAALLAGMPIMAAQAKMTVSSHRTSHVTCHFDVCTANSSDAVLNASELESMLQSSSVELKPTSMAADLIVASPISWSSRTTLTLNCYHSLIVGMPVGVNGSGSLNIEFGHKGDLIFSGGEIHFSDSRSSLKINGVSHRLVSNFRALVADIAADSSGNFALSRSLDAKSAGTFRSAPINSFSGKLEGLGHRISNLTILDKEERDEVDAAFVAQNAGEIDDLFLHKVNVSAKANGVATASGGIAGRNTGKIRKVAIDGQLHVTSNQGGEVGGAVGINSGNGLLEEVYTNVSITARDVAAGGVFGVNDPHAVVSAASSAGAVSVSAGYGGGLGGDNGGGARVMESLSIGRAGRGLVMYNEGHVSHSYWDVDTSHATTSGAGKGLNDKKLKAGLPSGFDPTIWAQSANINSGRPYLTAVMAAY